MRQVITENGALAGAEELSTSAIQKTIDAVAAAGGGTVVVPPGRFRTGTIFLKSHVNLHLEPGAVLVGSENLDDYTAVNWGHHKDRTPWHLLVAKDLDDVSITGTGEFDGSGPAFWKPERKSECHFWVEETMRPSPLVEITNCRDVRISDVTISNPPGWTLHVHDTDRLFIRGVRINANLFGPNNDGIDLTGVHDACVSDCYIRAGDDAIALKTTVDSRSCENITVTNCVLETNCSAIRLGHESVHDFRWCTFSNCVVKRAIRAIDLVVLQGCTVEHVIFSNITGTTNCGWPLTRPIQVQITPVDDMYEETLPPEHPRHGQHWPVKTKGVVRDVVFSDIDLETDGRVTVGAVEGATLRDLTFRNLRLRYPMIDNPQGMGKRSSSASFYIGDEFLEMREAPAAFVVQNADNLVVDGLQVRWPEGPVPERWLLLHSTMREANPDWYEGRDAEIRNREREPDFHVFWGRNVRGGRLRLSDTHASREGVPTLNLQDCQIEQEE